MNATNNVLKIILILKVYVVIKIVLGVNKHIRLNVFHVKKIFFYIKDNVEQVLR